MGKRNVEILAPAGSFESMVAAVNAGADAVYIGGSRFGARAYANNLDEEMMIRAIDYVHLHGAKIYMTVNTLVKEKELPDLYEYLKPYYEAGLDAVIVQDLGVFRYVREHFPKMDIHVSTQMTVTGKYSASKLKEMGAVRVVPARELTLGEIREIYDETGLEIETFVHGALCYCYSGQCLFSSLIGGRSGNRGRCAQPCRLPFDVVRDGRYINKKNEKYVLSLKDLCTLDLIPDILEAGVCSLKIEGRMKSPRYTAGVVSMYRKYVDMYLKNGRNGYKVDPADKRMLLDLFDRGGQSDGFYRVHNGRDMVVLKEKPAFREGNQELFDRLDRLYVDAVKKEKIQGTAYFEVGKPARLTLTAELTGRAAENETCDTKLASAASMICWVDGDIVEEAKNAPMDEARIRKQLMKTGDSPFEFEKLDVTIKGNIFVPVQALNSMRREALEGLEKGLLQGHKRQVEDPEEDGSNLKALTRCTMQSADTMEEQKKEFAALVNSKEQFEAAFGRMAEWIESGANASYGIYLASEEFDANGWKTLADRCHDAGISCYLMLPRIFRTHAERYFLKNLELLKNAGFDAFGVAAMEEPGFMQKYVPGAKLFFDHGMYTFNSVASGMMDEYGADRKTIPVELNGREITERGGNDEMIIYGYLPMMVSANCIKKTTEGCTGKPELLFLKDRKGKEMPVRNQCRFCYNTIYNESPMSLLGLSEEVERFEPSVLRLNFTIEDRIETEKILTAFHAEYMEGRKAAPLANFTRGHFKRGVE
ncbi:MAG: U32 family peptidase [Lachnospiraceae bacterium]|nr:U32 family peptidase [Lachnospiraceae bacterium]